MDRKGSAGMAGRVSNGEDMIENKDKIKNIIFDVGSILIGYRWVEMFRDEGVDEAVAQRIGHGLFDTPDWQRFDAGLINMAELIDNFCDREPDIAKEARWFLNNAIKMRVARPDVWAEVKRLKDKGYKLYILSNYSKELFDIHTTDYPFKDWMDGIVISYMMNVTKPGRGIYEYLLREYNLNGDECLFFDDRIENVEGAIACGINALHVPHGDEKVLLSMLQEL